MCGTKGYIAPEVLTSKSYSLPVDIWAFGILIYALVSSQLPFPVPEDKFTKENIGHFADQIFETKLQFPEEVWFIISENLKELLKGMLEKDPYKRSTIDDVLDHPWFQD